MKADVKHLGIIFWIVLVAVNAVVFYPSFYNCAKADQIVYLVETADIESLPELLDYSYSYCRTRVLLSGDKILFRPVFYSVLSVEKWLWGYHFIFWQLAGFFLHILNVLLLLKFLKRILPGLTAFFLALFFSVLYVGADMVTWHHMHGYLLFVAFVLAAMINFSQYIQGLQKDRKKLWSMTGFLALACFTNEFGVILSVLFLFILMAHRGYVLKEPLFNWKKQADISPAFNNPLVVLFPPLTYLYISFLDYTLRFSGAPVMPNLAGFGSPAQLLKTAYQFAALFCASFILPFSPGIFMIFPAEKNYAAFFSAHGFGLLDPYNKAIFLSNIFLWGAVAAALIMGVSLVVRGRRNILKDLRFTFFLSLAALISYIFVLVLFRTAQNSLTYLLSSLYHFYILALFAVIAMGCLYTLVNSSSGGQKKIFNSLVMVILCGGILLNSVKLYSLNRYGRELFGPWGKYIMRLNDFIEAHKNEDDFSFYSVTRNDAKATILRIGKVEQGDIKGYISDFLFRKYIDVSSPKYYVIYTREDGVLPFCSKEEAQEYGAKLSRGNP